MTCYLLLVPLAVLVSPPLSGFIGCGYATLGPVAGGCPTAIELTPGLVAYWRLGEPSTTPVPSSGGAAVDQKAGSNGDYRVLPPAAADTQRHSPGTAGTIFLGITPGLLSQLSEAPCIQVDEGYVQIPANDALNPPAFTFECWIDLTGFDQEPEGNYYCLVESTGRAGPRSTGFGRYLGPLDPTAPAGPYFWQVWMGDGTQFSQVAVGTQPVDASQSRLTYLALTFLGNNESVNDGQGHDLNYNLALYLYRPDTQQDLAVAGLQALTGTVNNFTPNTVANGGGGDFFIGTGTDLFPVAPSFVGVAAENSLDHTAQASGTSATSACGPVTTTSANELILAANTTSTASGSVAAAGSGYTVRVVTPDENIAEDQLVSVIGSFNAAAPLTASGDWVMQMATFRTGASQRLYTFKGKIQEVALYDADLSVDSSNALNIQLWLAAHEVSGGDL